MTPKPRYRRTHPDDQPPTTDGASEPGGPVVVPVVEFTINADGAMTVTVDGVPYLPEPFAPGWRRESFPTILDALTARYRSPLRVQVRGGGRVNVHRHHHPTPRTPHREALAAAPAPVAWCRLRCRRAAGAASGRGVGVRAG